MKTELHDLALSLMDEQHSKVSGGFIRGYFTIEVLGIGEDEVKIALRLYDGYHREGLLMTVLEDVIPDGSSVTIAFRREDGTQVEICEDGKMAWPYKHVSA